METPNKRPRANEVGLIVGSLPTGPTDSITDVSGVAVGHETLMRGDFVRTGVTAIRPHADNMFTEKVPAAIFVGNGFGKLVGLSQVNELGEIETPILLTNTLSVNRVADALVDHILSIPGNEEVRSVNPVVGETNDGFLNDIRGRHVAATEVEAALLAANCNPPDEGSVGAGTGTVALGFKGGIGSSSRRLPPELGGFTIGVLLQSNFGGMLTIKGIPIGEKLGRAYIKGSHIAHDGSVMVVIATDAFIDARNLRRLASRSQLGLARTGYNAANGSGDYFIAFSSSKRHSSLDTAPVKNEQMTPLFQAVVEATEEAVYNSLFRATTVRGRDNHVAEEIPIEEACKILRAHGAL